MSLLTKQSAFLRRVPNLIAPKAMYSQGDGHGEGGAVRAGGGSFAKREKAQEDQYFRKLQQEQLKSLKGHLDEEVTHHEQEIKHHQERIQQLKEKAKNLTETK